jgi:transcriptional regulator with XRE-family HTH domain
MENVREALEVTVGRRTRQFREQRGWSQADLGQRLGAYGAALHQTSISKLEAGARPIRLDEVGALADLFEVRPADLFEDAVGSDRVRKAEDAYRHAHGHMHAQALQHSRARQRLAAAEQEVTEAAKASADAKAAVAQARADLKAARRG